MERSRSESGYLFFIPGSAKGLTKHGDAANRGVIRVPKQSLERPNVIVFFTDQQRWDTTGVHGNPLDLTPNFDRMARHGTHVFNSFTCQPVCAPARSSLQTGLFATRTGVFRNGIALRSDTKTLAHHFRKAGYHTAYIGKWHLADEEPVPKGRRAGYEYWLGANLLEFTSEPYNTVLYDNENRPVKLPGYRVDALTDAAIRYIDARQRSPFYLFLSFLEPHHQNDLDDYVPPDGYRERYAGRWLPPDLAALGGSAHEHLGGYCGIVKRLDEALGRLLDALKSFGLTEHTVVLFTSDHGCHFKTRNWEYKRSCHESSIRVPTALQGPGFGGGRIRKLVSIIDLPPTILDAAGLPIPREMQGRSLLPLLRGETESWPEDVFVQISESEVGRAIRTRRWKYGVVAPHKEPWFDAVSDKYVEACLYDLESDPYELANLIGLESHQEVAEEMRERLIRCMVGAGEVVPVIEPSPVRPGV
ncbi:MAG: sulfatase-like hydrolase/transferase [Candidatus Hydrogenedentota bacterium]|nr:MAG: sulfatase-like hydrolase/transferase [Candidatus Hydrogenedentota bacterium]